MALPEGTEPEDADAVAHYQRNPADGCFYEYMGFHPSTAENPIYVSVADHVIPSLTPAGERAGLGLYTVDGPGPVPCPLCGGDTESLQLKGMRAYRCLAQREPACADGFFVLARE